MASPVPEPDPEPQWVRVDERCTRPVFSRRTDRPRAGNEYQRGVMARRGGATSFAVTTGFTKAADWAAQPVMKRPHHLLEGVGDLLKMKELGF